MYLEKSYNVCMGPVKLWRSYYTYRNTSIMLLLHISIYFISRLIVILRYNVIINIYLTVTIKFNVGEYEQ